MTPSQGLPCQPPARSAPVRGKWLGAGVSTTGYDWGVCNGTASTPPALSTTPNAIDIVGFEYIASLSAWCFLGAPFPQGF